MSAVRRQNDEHLIFEIACFLLGHCRHVEFVFVSSYCMECAWVRLCVSVRLHVRGRAQCDFFFFFF